MEKSKLKALLESKKVKLVSINPINKTIDETLYINDQHEISFIGRDDLFDQSNERKALVANIFNEEFSKLRSSIPITVDKTIDKVPDKSVDQTLNKTIDRTFNETIDKSLDEMSDQTINLKGQPLLVYHYLKPRTNSAVRPQQISDDLKISKDSVRSAISFLKKSGFIHQSDFKVGKGGYSVYRILK